MTEQHPVELTLARVEIDAIDQEMVSLLARRQLVVQKVIAIKKIHELPALIPERVDEVINNAVRLAEHSGASPGLVRLLWTQMVDWFVQLEKRELRGGGD